MRDKLRGVRITGVLDLAGGTVTPYVELAQCRFDGEVLLAEARFTTLRLVGCSLPRLEAARLYTQGDLCLPGCRVHRGVRLDGARVGGDLLLDRSVVESDRYGFSIMADGISVGQDLSAKMLESNGELSLRGATVGSTLSLRGSRLSSPGGLALNAPEMTVGRSLRLASAYSGDPFRTGPGGTRERDFRCVGGIRLDDGSFGEAIDLTRARFTLERDQEVSLRRVRTQELSFLGERPEEGRVVLSGARADTLVDNAESWPGPRRTLIDGFVYDHLIPLGFFPLDRRLAWLADATADFTPQPYEQLASVYRRSGERRAADRVRRAQLRRSRADLRWPGRAWRAVRDARGSAVTLWAVTVAALLVVAWLSTRAVLSGINSGAELGPSDASPVVVAVVSVITASGVLIGGVLNGLAKFVRARGQNHSDIVQARGQAEADLMRARAELRRAEADILRARVGLPPAEPSPSGPGSAPDTGRIIPPAPAGDDEGAPSPP
ncbi:hypothetical protein ACIOD0_07305 [Kitasatospora albolonga]